MDNASTHKTPAIHRWLLAHPRFTVHFTPTSSTWLNLVERWLAQMAGHTMAERVERGAVGPTEGVRQEMTCAPSCLAGIGTAALWLHSPRPGPPRPARAFAAAAVRVLTADYEMNEPVAASVMTDSSGNGLHGAIVQSAQIATGWVSHDGATGYHWLRRPPNGPPASPERVIQVPDHINLEPGSATGTFTIEMRYRTSNKFGNIARRGRPRAAAASGRSRTHRVARRASSRALPARSPAECRQPSTTTSGTC